VAGKGFDGRVIGGVRRVAERLGRKTTAERLGRKTTGLIDPPWAAGAGLAAIQRSAAFDSKSVI
jgi:hypothetical protein